MKRIELSQGKVALVDDGDFAWLSKWKWSHNGGYAVRAEGPRGAQRRIAMHREIMQAPKGMVVDHINHDRLDNRRENLRVVDYSANALNRARTIREGFSSKYRGVARRSVPAASKPWRAYFGKKDLATTVTEEEAARLYDLAALRALGPAAQLNFPVRGIEMLRVGE